MTRDGQTYLGVAVMPPTSLQAPVYPEGPNPPNPPRTTTLRVENDYEHWLCLLKPPTSDY